MVASKAMTMAGLGSMVLGVVLIIVLYGIVYRTYDWVSD
jgi:hypothetical protein